MKIRRRRASPSTRRSAPSWWSIPGPATGPGSEASSSIPRSASPSGPATRSTSSGSTRAGPGPDPGGHRAGRVPVSRGGHPPAPRHGNKPFVIGNCQAGWAVAALAAVRPELTGPVAFVGCGRSLTGRGLIARTRCATTAGSSAVPGRGTSWPTRARDPRRRVVRSELREPRPGHPSVEEALRPLLRRRHRGATLPRLRAPGGVGTT